MDSRISYAFVSFYYVVMDFGASRIAYWPSDFLLLVAILFVNHTVDIPIFVATNHSLEQFRMQR